MTNQEYLNHLTRRTVKELRDLHHKITDQAVKRGWKKRDIIQKLYDKFKELNKDNPTADTYNPDIDPAVGIEKNNYHTVTSRPGSRRSIIIEAIKEGIWDTATLAEMLNNRNEDWPLKKNKVAVSGTIADLRKNKGWKITTDDKGRICHENS